MKTLLIVEDEPSIMDILRYTLKGYRLIESTTVEEALRLFAQHGRHVDLLLADVTLPKSSGLRVAFFLRAELRDLPVILTSGNPVANWSDTEHEDLERIGPDTVAIVQKPFSPKVILKLVHELLGAASEESMSAQGENS
jgi:two-component system phosphate regulon response regulator PhoB